MVGIETPVKPGGGADSVTDYGGGATDDSILSPAKPEASVDGNVSVGGVSVEAELSYVRRQLEEERRRNEDLKTSRDRWLVDMESTLGHSRTTLERVQTQNLELQAEVAQARASSGAMRMYHPLTSPGSPAPQPASHTPTPAAATAVASTVAPAAPTAAQAAAAATAAARARRPVAPAILSPRASSPRAASPAKRGGARSGSARAGNHAGNAVSCSADYPANAVGGAATSSVAKASWQKFVRLASDKFSAQELVLISLETLKALMKHYQLRDPIECARIEVFWRLLAIHREGASQAASPPTAAALAAHRDGTMSPARRAPGGVVGSQKRSRSQTGSFVPVEHPRPFSVRPVAKGPHLSRRTSLKADSPRAADPNRSVALAAAAAANAAASGAAPAEGRKSIRTYNGPSTFPSGAPATTGAAGGGLRSSSKRSRSAAAASVVPSCPAEPPSSFHPAEKTGLRTYAQGQAGGPETTQERALGGKRILQHAAPAEAAAPAPPRALRMVPQQEEAQRARRNGSPRAEGLRVSQEWRGGRDSFGESLAVYRDSGCSVLNPTCSVTGEGLLARGRRADHPAHACTSPTVHAVGGQTTPSAAAGLRVTSRGPAGTADPNPDPRNAAAIAISDRKGERGAGLKVNDSVWVHTNHAEQLSLGESETRNPVRVEAVVPPLHVSPTRRTHSYTDLHSASAPAAPAMVSVTRQASLRRSAAAAPAAATATAADSRPTTTTTTAAPAAESLPAAPTSLPTPPQVPSGPPSVAASAVSAAAAEVPLHKAASVSSATANTATAKVPTPVPSPCVSSARPPSVAHSLPSADSRTALEDSAEDFERAELEAEAAAAAAAGAGASSAAGLPSHRIEGAAPKRNATRDRTYAARPSATRHRQVPRVAELAARPQRVVAAADNTAAEKK